MSGSSPDSFPLQANFSLFFLQFIFFLLSFFTCIYVCVPHVPWSKDSLQFSFSVEWVPGIKLRSTDLVASPLVSEPSYHPFLEFIELTLHVLEVSKDPNSRATPKEFSAAC